jgi:hypothetical protein
VGDRRTLGIEVDFGATLEPHCRALGTRQSECKRNPAANAQTSKRSRRSLSEALGPTVAPGPERALETHSPDFEGGGKMASQIRATQQPMTLSTTAVENQYSDYLVQERGLSPASVHYDNAEPILLVRRPAGDRRLVRA